MSNRVFIEGRVCQNPKIKETEVGPVASFTIANHDNKNGEAEFIPIVAFGNKVKTIVQPFVFKGTKVHIEGSLRSRKVGSSTYVEVNVIRLHILASGLPKSQDVLTEAEEGDEDA